MWQSLLACFLNADDFATYHPGIPATAQSLLCLVPVDVSNTRSMDPFVRFDLVVAIV